MNECSKCKERHDYLFSGLCISCFEKAQDAGLQKALDSCLGEVAPMKTLTSASLADIQKELAKRKAEEEAEKAKGAEPELPIEIEVYVHGSKEGNWENLKEEGYSDKFIDENDLVYLGYEVGITYRIMPDGEHKIVAVNGKRLPDGFF